MCRKSKCQPHENGGIIDDWGDGDRDGEGGRERGERRGREREGEKLELSNWFYSSSRGSDVL